MGMDMPCSITMLGLSVAIAIGLAPAPRPNVVVILTDDVGYGDLSCYGAKKVSTPNIDSIAKQGIRFTDAHSPSTVCTPTRYALLTGEYAFRHAPGAGILSGVAGLCIPSDKQTLPKMMREAGYQTGVVGKWHLGLGTQPTNYNGLITPGPKDVGFDESFVIPATGDRVPCVFVENGRVRNLDAKDPIEVSFGKPIGNEPTGKTHPELLKIKPVVGHADTIINGVSRIGFMTGGKTARWVDEDIADVLTKEAVGFIDRNRKRPFFLYFATHDVHAPLLPNKRFEGKNDCGLRGYTLAELDWSVGEVLKTLKRNGLYENTIVIFTSDNGAVDSDGYADVRENMNGHTVNGVLRGTKYTLFEGGHRVPFLLSWPKRTPSGRTSAALVAHLDLPRSLAAVAGFQVGERAFRDSVDLSAAFFSGLSGGRKHLVHHLGGAKSPLAYRSGNWVVVPQGQDWALFDLSKDLAQKNDLAKDHPEIVKRLVEALDTERTQTQ